MRNFLSVSVVTASNICLNGFNFKKIDAKTSDFILFLLQMTVGSFLFDLVDLEHLAL